MTPRNRGGAAWGSSILRKMSGLSTPVAPVDLSPPPVLELGPEPVSRRQWLRSLWDHRGVIWVLARKDFQARYKRTSLGVLWAAAVPLLQAVVMIFVFSHFIHVGRGVSYAAFVLSGILVWGGYFTSALPQGTTAIVDGSTLTDKLWFPRAILALVPCVSNLVGLGIAVAILLVGGALLGEAPGVHSLLVVPACALLVAFTMALTMVLSALHVYFRDVRFLVTAAITVWLYATPIMYPQSRVGALGPWLDFNPMTGIISMFHASVIDDVGSFGRAVAVSVVATLVLIVVGVEAQRRHDRLFADLL
jgi:ABC-type polysaccharide/polyol phosphate export permease